MATDLSAPVDRLQAVETSIVGFTTAEKLELIERVARSIRSEAPARLETDEELSARQQRTRTETHAVVVALTDDPVEKTRIQRENLDRMIRELEELPTISHDDGLTNRDHDKILYEAPS